MRHLFKADETFGLRLTSYHNLYFLLNLMKQVRQAIMDDNLLEFKEHFFEEYGLNVKNPKNFLVLKANTLVFNRFFDTVIRSTYTKEANIVNSSISTIVMFVVLFGLMYFMMIRPQKKQQQQRNMYLTDLHIK